MPKHARGVHAAHGAIFSESVALTRTQHFGIVVIFMIRYLAVLDENISFINTNQRASVGISRL